MRKTIIILGVFLLPVGIVLGQGVSLKEQALEEFRKEHYNEAISLLEKAVKETPKDADLYYYLGWFNHYRAYDSRPLVGYDYNYSSSIFGYLDKALELNPNYGDAKYFYGAECSGNAFLAMQNHDAAKLRYFYELAFNKGAFPPWLVEFGKNFLMACDKDAIVFTGGNADFDICAYLQLIEKIRTDITVIPIGNLDRPWYVSFLKQGLEDCVRSVKISMTEQQIMDIHPFKWRTSDIAINISQKDRAEFNLPDNYKFVWSVKPDLTSERMHAKMVGEEEKPRTYLSPQKAVLLHIIENNMDERSMYFSIFADPFFYGGLETNFQNCGLVSRLIPLQADKEDFAYDVSKMATLINLENLENYSTIKTYDLPRISSIMMYGYSMTIKNLADIYRKSGKKRELEQLSELYQKRLKIGFNPKYEETVAEELKP
jgi:tetratricopeptide (TPR) repeat protein